MEGAVSNSKAKRTSSGVEESSCIRKKGLTKKEEGDHKGVLDVKKRA